MDKEKIKSCLDKMLNLTWDILDKCKDLNYKNEMYKKMIKECDRIIYELQR